MYSITRIKVLQELFHRLFTELFSFLNYILCFREKFIGRARKKAQTAIILSFWEAA